MNCGDYRTLDDVPDTLREAYNKYGGEDNGRERQISSEDSSYDELYRQIGELSLSEHEMAIMVYLVGSLDENGFLSKDDETLCDELAFKEYIDTTPEEINRLAKLLQQFEPKGIRRKKLERMPLAPTSARCSSAHRGGSLLRRFDAFEMASDCLQTLSH